MNRQLPGRDVYTAWPGIALLALLALGYACYMPGLSGGFLFDDYVNLNKVARYDGVDDWRTLANYLFGSGGNAGGRAIARLSFLIDDNDWPSDPTQFKYTSLLFHLLTMVAAGSLALQLARAYGCSRTRQETIALLTMAVWGLHPFFVSTVLYIVQRMAILAALFVFAGLGFYVIGRRHLAAGRQTSGFFYMSLGVGLFTPLAYLSKQNGALLPLLALVIDNTLLRHLPMPSVPAWLTRAWRALFLYLPLALMATYFVANWSDVITHRATDHGFGPIERLMTQPRVLVDYLQHLFVPRIQTSGLYHDDYSVSSSLLSPAATLPALLITVALLVLGLLYRYRLPVVSFAVLFFFAAHIIESSFIPIELYYEHRNYLPAFGLAFAAGYALTHLRPRNCFLVSTVLIAVLTGFTTARASLWGDEARLIYTWAQENPASVRAQQNAAQLAGNQNQVHAGLEFLRRGLAHNPESTVLYVQQLAMSCFVGQDTEQARQRAHYALSSWSLHNYVLRNLKFVADLAISGKCHGLTREQVLALVDTVLNRIQDPDPLGEDVWFLRGRLLLSLGRSDEATSSFRRSVRHNGSVAAGLKSSATLASANEYEHALDILDLAETMLEKRPQGAAFNLRKRLASSVIDYREEIAHLREQIRKTRQND